MTVVLRSRLAVDESTLETFAETGVAKLRKVFSAEDAELMRDVVWRDLLHSEGVHREDRTTWRRASPRRKLARAKRDPIFRAMFGATLRALADALLGEGWVTSAAFGNLLVDFPDARRWHLPGRDGFWHSDFGNDPRMDPLPGLRAFVVFGDVPPGGGGTLLVAGSARMISRFVEAHPDVPRSHRAAVAWHRSIPWLRDLTLSELPSGRSHEDDEARRRRFMDTVTDVDGIPARVVEACGRPGDVYVCHPWTIHCKPPNASDRPRFLRAPTLVRGNW
ncbi:MAG TPA: hypothetical protein VEP49_12440 [Acidimicrobiia bacterium]|nr:hypothetical protein [Acidimicrobiia bacterium]